MNNEEKLMILLSVIENQLKVNSEQLTSDSHRRELVWARYIFVAIVDKHLHWQQAKVYQFLNRNRTSVIHCRKKHSELLEVNDTEYTYTYKNVLDVFEHDIEIATNKVVYTVSENEKIRLFNKRMLIGLEC